MSEEDVDLLGPDGQASSRVDRDRRPPRFSWTPAYETTFFRSLCDSVQLGLRENSSFKAEAWERAAQALQDKHGAYPTKSHLINKSDNARKRFRLWRGLRENPDFIHDAVSKTVTATEDAWRAHIEREPLSKALRGRPFDHEEYMEILYPDVIGSGGAPKRITKPKRRTDGQPGDEPEISGAVILNLQSDSAAGHASQDNPILAQPSTCQASNGSGMASGPQTRPTPLATLSSRSISSQSFALSPPEEPAIQTKKRALSASQVVDDVSISPPPPPPLLSASKLLTTSAGDFPDKRPRISSHDNSLTMPTSSNPVPSTVVVTRSESPGVVTPGAPITQASPPDLSVGERACDNLANTRWREKALDQFFRDFADDDIDLQIRIAQTVLTDENKALVYCKMPWRVKQHWIKRLDEAFRTSP